MLYDVINGGFLSDSSQIWEIFSNSDPVAAPPEVMVNFLGIRRRVLGHGAESGCRTVKLGVNQPLSNPWSTLNQPWINP